jgi:hypothetical protein
MMSNFSECVIMEIDRFINEQKGFDVFDLPVDGCDVEGEVNPIFSSFLNPNMVYILEIKPEVGSISYINLYTIDGGIFVFRSDESKDFKKLMPKTNEGWTEF